MTVYVISIYTRGRCVPPLVHGVHMDPEKASKHMQALREEDNNRIVRVEKWDTLTQEHVYY